LQISANEKEKNVSSDNEIYSYIYYKIGNMCFPNRTWINPIHIAKKYEFPDDYFINRALCHTWTWIIMMFMKSIHG